MYEVFIPNEVYNEILSGEEGSDVGKKELIEAVIAAREMDIEYVIIDERSARSFARSFNLNPIGILGILQRAKELGKIGSLKPLLDELIANNFRISEKLYSQLLESAGEK